MRIKVESVPPLPHVKAWYSANALPSVVDLKASLCASLPALSHDRIRPQDLLLLLDDFELLDASPIDVLRDGDLIVIKKRLSAPPTKRKAPSEAASPARKRTKTDDGRAILRTPQPSAPERRDSARPKSLAALESSSDSDASSNTSADTDSGSESSSEEDSSDSESDSDTSSDDSTSTSSSTSSSASSPASASTHAPPVQTSRQKPTNGVPKNAVSASKAQPAKPAPPLVPPGLGKPSTHSRNIRRRRKKMFERLAATAEPTSVNEIPLGTRARTLEPSTATGGASEEPEAPRVRPQQSQAKGKGKAPERELSSEAPSFMMASLQNKNKRRGFKSALTQGVPPKIIFPDAGSAAGTSIQMQPPQQAQEQQGMDVDPDAQLVEAALQLQPSPPDATPASMVTRPQPRLIPPSEKQALGLIPANMFVTSVDVEEGMWSPKNKKKKKKKKTQPRAEETWNHEDEGEGESFAGGLPYDDVPAPSAPESARMQNGGIAVESTEHAVVAAKWDTLRKITDQSQVQPGTTVGWKALGINFATLTPEMLLHVGRVVRCDEQLVIEPIAESSPAEVSFGGPVIAEEGGALEETFEWSDVLQGDWRLVSAR
ncbi:hypothetical protein BD414DRAFT_537359 [Trametes punicea]|nr:hypothetical protein BD414DRAFT_537359 [Trametes punicea]